MCGIIAYHNKKGISKESLNDVIGSLANIKHRGVDGEGLVLINTNTGKQQLLNTRYTPNGIKTDVNFDNYEDLSADLILAHRRLSIIDLSTNGFQPKKDDHNNVIIFNGEVYNYVEIKKELEKSGYTFKTNSDTEVILTAYHVYGEKCFAKFNGMWSIIIWDDTNKKLIVSNDRFGVKQLYCYQDEEEMLFSSEIKAFYPFKKSVRGLNHQNINVFLNEGMLDINDETFFSNIYKFPKAHAQKIDLVTYQRSSLQYWKNNNYVDHTYTQEKAIEEFNYLISDAIKIRLRADVECGIALSGGLDSSLICYYADDILKKQNTSSRIKSFSVIFPDQAGDESYFSKYIVDDLKLDGKFVNPFKEFSFSDLEKLTYHLDYPLQSTSYYASWSLMRLVSQNGLKVLLEGQGADELFGGYHYHFYKYGRELILTGKIKRYFFEVNAYAKYKNRPALEIHRIIINEVKLLTKIKIGISKQKFKKEYFKLIEALEQDLQSTMLPGMLRCDDRSSMAFSVETRLPFMDYRIVEFAAKLPSKYKIHNGWQKDIIRRSAFLMPDEIRFRKDKKGFTTPQDEWMKKYKKDFMDYLPFLEKAGLGFSIEEIVKLPNDRLFRYYALGMWLKTI